MQASIGRILWFFPAGHSRDGQPLPAVISFVHSDAMVNLAFWNQNGTTQMGKTFIPLFDNMTDLIAAGNVDAAVWMPYQVQQAAVLTASVQPANKPGF